MQLGYEGTRLDFVVETFQTYYTIKNSFIVTFKRPAIVELPLHNTYSGGKGNPHYFVVFLIVFNFRRTDKQNLTRVELGK